MQVLILLSLLCVANSFTESDDDFARMKRKLLQTEENNEEESLPPSSTSSQDEKKEPVKAVEKPREPQSGPLDFYDGQFFAMSVGKPIVVTVFERDGTRAADIVLNGEATSVKGSIIKAEEKYLVNLDWKGVEFQDKGLQLKNIFLKMEFHRDAKEYRMTSMDAESIRIGPDEIISNPLKVKSDRGYDVKAPIGTSFGCYKPGMFHPANDSSDSAKYNVGITLPSVRLQVFKLVKSRFGPEWNCANLLSIGLWTTLLLSSGFALICIWGFSMIAGISTMDRFDDPKGKPLQIGSTE